MKLLSKIEFKFPCSSPSETAFFSSLSELLLSTPAINESENGLVISATAPNKAFPVAELSRTKESSPSIVFDTDLPLGIDLVGLLVRSSTTQKSTIKPASINPARVKDSRISAADLLEKFSGHIVRVDHTGLNIPAKLCSRKDFDSLANDLSKVSALYNYPTGEPWPFILPATESEFSTDISEFTPERFPKFELVHDTLSPIPVLQFDVETDLLRSEVERLLPRPYGITFPGFADFFRTAYLDHPWPNLRIRFDFRYKNDYPADDWATGKWLVKDGKRYRES